jgi:hypothetical protein
VEPYNIANQFTFNNQKVSHQLAKVIS